MIRNHRIFFPLLAALVLAGSAGSAFAQDDNQFEPEARPMFVTLPAHLHPEIAPPAASLRFPWRANRALR